MSVSIHRTNKYSCSAYIEHVFRAVDVERRERVFTKPEMIAKLCHTHSLSFSQLTQLSTKCTRTIHCEKDWGWGGGG